MILLYALRCSNNLQLMDEKQNGNYDQMLRSLLPSKSYANAFNICNDSARLPMQKKAPARPTRFSLRSSSHLSNFCINAGMK